MRFIDGIPLLIKRVLTFAFLGAILLFIALGVFNYFSKPQNPPTVAEAPYIIQTSSRVYYGKEMSMNGVDPAFKGYWTLDGNRYNFHSDIIKFNHEIFGSVKIIERRK